MAQDPGADFSLLVGYQNDARIPRDRQGFLVLDMDKLSGLAGVKPILAEVPRGTIPLAQASAFGLKPLSRVRAQVRVTVELPGLPMPVQPQDIAITEVTIDGVPAAGDTLERLNGFIRAQLAASRWLPASDKGTWKSRSEETFTVEVVQASAARAAERPPGAGRHGRPGMASSDAPAHEAPDLASDRHRFHLAQEVDGEVRQVLSPLHDPRG